MFTITNTTRRPTPSLPFAAVARDILGKQYALSLVLCGRKRMQRLSLEYVGEPGHVNVLAFPLDSDMGEIYIGLDVAFTEAARFGHDYETHVLFLFTHGCLHLKGLQHGAEMEREEERFLARYLAI